MELTVTTGCFAEETEETDEALEAEDDDGDAEGDEMEDADDHAGADDTDLDHRGRRDTVERELDVGNEAGCTARNGELAHK